MTMHSHTKLVPLEVRHEETLETIEISRPDQLEQSKLELDIEVDCPRCSEIMELYSNFDRLMYYCKSCNLSLRCL
jgi:phage FluMu protein Com